MLKIDVFVFFSLPRELVSDVASDYKDSMNSTGCGS
jgi:hypothetical protein